MAGRESLHHRRRARSRGGAGPGRGVGSCRRHLWHRHPCHPRAFPVDAASRDGSRVFRRGARSGARGEQAAARANGGMRAVVRLRGMLGLRGGAHLPVPASCVHPLPDGLDPVTAAMTEPAACCLSGLETFSMPRGATVLVIGGGIMGLLTMALARRRGAKRLILSDPLEERRRIARRLGAQVVVDPSKESLRDRIMSLTKDRGADVVCEAVGKPELVAEALALTRATGYLQLVGVNPKGSTLPLDLWDVHYREIRIGGAFGRGTAFRRALAMMPKLGVSKLVTARFPLYRIAEAFAHASAGHGAKTVITPS